LIKIPLKILIFKPVDFDTFEKYNKMDEDYLNKILSFDKMYEQSELHGNSIT